MACDYQAIRADNERRYGTDIGRIGPILLSERYDDRTHFIFELLQNTEDALARHPGWQGSRSVNFRLTDDVLHVSHFGKPFDEEDVRGICGIAESAKDPTAIGRFGIGFKSVYAFTDRPEIHSGQEDFAIESYVWPVATPTLNRGADETVILIPLKASNEEDHEEIAVGLQRLGGSALLFLRQIEEISWSVKGGKSGLYLRESKEADAGVRRITVIGQEQGADEIEETWIVFSRPVSADDGLAARHVEIAFFMAKLDDSEPETIRRIGRSLLVVFFPTVLETHLGFLLQGPYCTTPSRDNVPRNDPWNQRLVRETALLLVETLRWLRDHGMLTPEALQCLPLDPVRFGEGTRFAPLFEATKEALSFEPLLPRFDTGYVPGANARLARTRELRELFAPPQLAALLRQQGELIWLSGDITQDRTPELRQYLMRELGIAEVTAETIIPKLDKPFLEAQPDDWIHRLYHFLSDQPALRRRFADLPLIRLEDGTHVVAHLSGQPQAFLPGGIKTGFPTVRASVCATDPAREFLRSLGLTEPDPVDDVVWNVLPKYGEGMVDVADPEYAADIGRVLAAFGTDSKGQREKLVKALRETAFVRVVDAGDGSKRVAKPGELYLATGRLKELFAGVPAVLLVDDSYACLRGQDVRELLEACGATRYLERIPAKTDLTPEQLRGIRRNAGLERSSWEKPVSDATLRGLNTLLNLLPRLDPEARLHRAGLLWEALTDVENRRGSQAFLGEYTWSYSHTSKTATFDAAFVRQLNATAWVPAAGDKLQPPEFVLFESLGWKPNPFLQSKIRFKPPVIEALAREAGIDPGLLDLLKKLGVTSEADLKERFGIKDEPKAGNGEPDPGDVDDSLKKLQGELPQPTPTVSEPAGAEQTPPGGGGTGSSRMEAGRQSAGSGALVPGDGRSRGEGGIPGADGLGAEKSTARSAGARPFISYLGTDPEEEGPDPDRLDHQARIALEEKAIGLILAREPELRRTATNNPGFDLFADDASGVPGKWVEVKAMTGTMQDRPVGVSRTQFECAREHGDAYWLYVVEFAGSPDQARIVRIQDPAGRARTFTFDQGWLSIAELDDGGGLATE